MDLKRKSELTPGVSSSGGHSKKAKTNVLENTSQSSNTSKENQGHEIHQLPADKLVEDVLEKLRMIESQPPGLKPAIVKAAAELNRALHSVKPATSSDVACENYKGRLPPLPPILDEKLERAVFTHPGVNSNHDTTYDRLEILGDAYIELIATKLIWTKFDRMASGRISQIRELLVKNETLSEYATGYGLDKRAIVPQDYLSQPKRWTKTLGDIFEAYVAAIILSDPICGYSVAEKWLKDLWLPKLGNVDARPSVCQAKEQLAKKIMGKGIKLRYVDERPPVQHRNGIQTFFIGVYLTGWGWHDKCLGSGQGPSKGIAGNAAAQAALQDRVLTDEIASVKKRHESKTTPGGAAEPGDCV
ncbi:ribonuclease III [Aspergillus campestris IBT 28561]|uniref:Ribonuclease III n=1 Tax=Aspergillus campestris (strain IBT 28561) TaxID=1392248 RepID=A0A2I1D2A1_ASPC2|nr:ribonuclease III [Aspergillus campestris IBT 28561]PKY03987.1 ribonuclease III [Aspergillus campestris IBT 28561]